MHRLGFPETVPLNEFVRRFGLLSDSSTKEISVESILSSNEIDCSSYRIGPSQVSDFYIEFFGLVGQFYENFFFKTLNFYWIHKISKNLLNS